MTRLHITNGDSAAVTLREAMEDRVETWMDVLHQGPVPAVPPQDLAVLRAQYLLSESGELTFEALMAAMRRREEMLSHLDDHSEVVLWFEHDLYDQLLLVQLLDRLASRELGHTRLALICIDRFAGIDRFLGLGQLTAGQLRELWPHRQPVRQAQLRLAQRAWAAFTSPTPRPLEALLSVPVDDLPFLEDALRRLLAEYPSTTNGLGLTQQLIGESLQGGAASGRELFLAVSARERAPYLGDSTFYAILGDLTRGAHPLIQSAPVGRPWSFESAAETILALTPFAEEILSGRADYVRANGIDRWIGGVHLEGPEAGWRWDGRGVRTEK